MNGSIDDMITTIDSAGRLVVPKAIRDAARLRPGTRVRFRVEAGRVEIEPVPLAVTLERRGSLVVAVPQQGGDVLTESVVAETTAELRAGGQAPKPPE